MRFGITVSQINEVDLAVRAERLGYDFVWAWDSPMIRSNVWAVLTLVADRTSTIRLGPGVSVPALRMAPVTANAIATINAIAPGRTFLGLGTGNTALRAMGQLPMKQVDFAEHIRVIKGLLAGDTVEYVANGITHPIRFQSLELGHVDLDHRIPIHVGGHTDIAARRAGRLGDGFFPGKGTHDELARSFDIVRETAVAHGRDPGAIEMTTGGNGVVGGRALEEAAALQELGVGRVIVPAFLFYRDTAESLARYGEEVISRVG
ncbi:MAG: LLM class flavin-dependent oxidoreductase [Ilumatobacteraceae bacterium]